MVPVKIVGPNKKSAVVSPHGALSVFPEIPPLPPVGTANRERFFRHKLTGMNINGSSTAQEFGLGAASDADIHITTASIVIADTGVAHNTFGGVNALTNGWSLRIDESGNVSSLIDDAKTGGQVIAQSVTRNGGADSATSYELVRWTGNDDATLVVLDLDKFVAGGIRIGRGTKDRIFSRVADNLTGLTEFTVYLQGYKRYP